MSSNTLRNLRSAIEKYRFVFLLGTLLFLLLSIPPLQYLEQFGYDLIVPLIFSGVYLLVVLSGAATAATQSRQFTISCVLAAFVFLGQIFTLLTRNTSIFIIEQISSACFLFYIQYLLMVFLFTGRKVTVNVISASLCGYLLLALLWANLFSLAELFEPGSFVFAYQKESDSVLQSIKMDSSNSIMAIYYSLVTLTTLGYGDIAPLTHASRMLAALEAVVGQIYLTVLIARLVGLHIADASNPTVPGDSRKP